MPTIHLFEINNLHLWGPSVWCWPEHESTSLLLPVKLLTWYATTSVFLCSFCNVISNAAKPIHTHRETGEVLVMFNTGYKQAW